MDGGVLGLGAGSTISGYEIAGIGHGVHMRLVTYPIRLVSYWAGCGSCAASAVFQRKIYALDALCLAAPPQVTAALKVRVEALQAGKSTRSGDARAGRTFTGTSGSCACAGLGTTCRG
jgi:hypothetical protein